MILSSKRGVTILELIIALVILVVIVLAFTQLQVTAIKGTRTAVQQSSLARSISLVKADIVKDDRYLPAQEIPQGADPWDTSTLDKFLTDPELGQTRCYSEAGAAIEDQSGDCTKNGASHFVVRYVKFRQPDMSFYANANNPAAKPDNELNRIPMGHYRIRIDYPNERKGMKSLYVSHFVTSAIVY